MTPNTSIGTSNIIPNELHFDLNAFRSLKMLTITAVPPENVSDAGKIPFLIQENYSNNLIKHMG